MPGMPNAASRMSGQTRGMSQGVARVLAFWAAALLVLVGTGALRGMLPPLVAPLAWGLAGAALVALLIGRFLRADGRPWSHAGLGWTARTPVRLMAGLATGIATSILTLAATAAALGPIGITRTPTATAGAMVVIAVGIAALVLMEELVFRSYALWAAVDAIGAWPAQALVAAAFCLLHVAYGWPRQAIVQGVLPSAVLFGVAAVISGGLALPVGVHLGMNLTRWLTGQGSDPGLWVLDTSALDPARAASLAPLIGAAVPLVVAVVLYAARGVSPSRAR